MSTEHAWAIWHPSVVELVLVEISPDEERALHVVGSLGPVIVFEAVFESGVIFEVVTQHDTQ